MTLDFPTTGLLLGRRCFDQAVLFGWAGRFLPHVAEISRRCLQGPEIPGRNSELCGTERETTRGSESPKLQAQDLEPPKVSPKHMNRTSLPVVSNSAHLPGSELTWALVSHFLTRDFNLRS